MTSQGTSFDDVAGLYDEVRPDLPPEAVEALLASTRIEPGDGVLEVGCGTGQLTAHLLRHGAAVTAVEPGASLAAVCRAKHEGGRLRVVESTFEAWSPGTTRYRAVVACQAAHWIDPRTFLDRACDRLDDGGSVGLVWHIDRSEGTAFWQRTQPLYDRYLPDSANVPPRTLPSLIDAYARSLCEDARFGEPTRWSWPWTRRFDEGTYLRLLQTHSPVRMLGAADRAAFLDGHRRLLREVGGSVERTYETVLFAARREMA